VSHVFHIYSLINHFGSRISYCFLPAANGTGFSNRE